ncbi:MAG: sugar ABC transporter permease [Firmicutes bacterium]|nr:sugar ABC transporter permease [Bacillota bacterium]
MSLLNRENSRVTTTTPRLSGKIHISLKKQETITGWLFILPILIGFLVFVAGSVIYSLVISLTKWDLLTPPVFIGIQNYIRVFKDESFWQCMYNTVYFVIGLVPSVLILSMLTAIAINQKVNKLTSFFKVSFYIPNITSTIAVSMIWLWILNPTNGLINTLLHLIGITNTPMWLQSVVWAKPALIIMRIWQMCGYYMIMFLAGLQTIPETLYEAAEVDGARKWQKYRYITVPMLSNTTFFVTIMLIIEAFNIFEAIFVMTEGRPAGSTNTLLYYIYYNGFQYYRMGYASALAWILFAILFVLTLIQFRLRRKKEQQ